MHTGSNTELSSIDFLGMQSMESSSTYCGSCCGKHDFTKNERENGQNRTLLHNNWMECPEDKTDTKTYYQRRSRRNNVVRYVCVSVDTKISSYIGN